MRADRRRTGCSAGMLRDRQQDVKCELRLSLRSESSLGRDMSVHRSDSSRRLLHVIRKRRVCSKSVTIAEFRLQAAVLRKHKA